MHISCRAYYLYSNFMFNIDLAASYYISCYVALKEEMLIC